MSRHSRAGLILIITITAMCMVWLLSCSDSSTKTDKAVYRIMDSQLKMGYHDVCWNQLDRQSQRVAAGNYQAHLTAGNYDTTIAFVIATSSARVSAPDCCDTSTVSPLKPSGQSPDRFGMILNSAAYAAGDSIAVTIALPVSCNCVLEISQR